MWEKIEVEEGPDMTDPVLLVSLSTSVQQYRALYSHARELGKFMLKRMKFRRFATIYSSALPPIAVISDDGIVRLSSASFYHCRAGRDIVLLAGDASPIEEQHEFCEVVLDYARGVGIDEVISIGTRWTEEAAPPTQPFGVKGFATEPAGVGRLEALGVTIIRDEPAPYFSSLVVALAEKHGMRGYKLSVDHGEPAPHPKSVAELLSVLQKMLGFEVDVGELDRAAQKMAARLEDIPGPDASPRQSGIYG